MVTSPIDENNKLVLNVFNFNIQETMLLKSLEIFYSSNHNFNILYSIVTGENIISRRTIEYFVTKYSNLNNITYLLNEYKFSVYSSYKDQLKLHKKKYFDPFGRGDRIPFFSNDTCILTTIGQLNFYKWFISKKIYDYCLSNHVQIQTSLLSNFSDKKEEKNTYKKQKIHSFKNNINYEYKNNNLSLSVTFDI